jgi:hypothetical protein
MTKETLPTNYVAAKQALVKCTRIDECKSWADKAMALASYGKQMKDQSMMDMARRIQDRAVQRGGALLLQVKTAKGKGKKTDRSVKEGVPPNSRKAAAESAGLSPGQARQMIRVANVPKDQFEQLVEGANPPTVERLAEIGTKKKPEHVKPAPYRNEWIDWINAVRHLSAIPACGLDVLAERRSDENEQLLIECDDALANLASWKQALEKTYGHGPKATGETKSDGATARNTH